MSSADNEIIKIPPLKLLFDKIMSLILLIIFLPLSLLLIIAVKIDGLFIKEDKGPVFYIEKRVSQGKPFNLLKFRIYKLSAIEKIKKGAHTKSVENEPGNLIDVGWLLKKWGFDEIPQLINVLKGDISIVGPRPKPTAEYLEEINRGIMNRKLLKAGLTGPVQVLKGTNRSYEDELAADNEYVEKCRNLSQIGLLAEDIKILFKTVKVMFKGTGE
jgi:lipopolysaccharide/colanic/teichoic acid biosynthesis glycosyltransferase